MRSGFSFVQILIVLPHGKQLEEQMKLSWIGRSAIVVAGVIVLALVGLQFFYPDFFKIFYGTEKNALLNFPLLVIASIGSINFLQNSKGMNELFRSPWQLYSWSVLGFSGGLVISYLNKLIFLIAGTSSARYDWIGSLLMSSLYVFIIIGLAYENYRATDKKVKDVNFNWVFIVCSVLLACVYIFTPLKDNRFLENLLYQTIICLLPAYLCISIISKNDGFIRDIYKLILLSQIVFLVALQGMSLMKQSMFAPLTTTIVFLTFAVVFDLRTSLYLQEKSSIAITENEEQKEVA